MWPRVKIQDPTPQLRERGRRISKRRKRQTLSQTICSSLSISPFKKKSVKEIVMGGERL